MISKGQHSTAHSGAKSHCRGIRDFKHITPTYLVLLESSGHPEINFDNYEKMDCLLNAGNQFSGIMFSGCKLPV